MIILAQTDTTVGFLSSESSELDSIKSRAPSKKYLKVFDSISSLLEQTRVPNAHKNAIRQSKKTTFIIKNRAFRVVKDERHKRLISKFKWLYSTSANESNKSYDRDFCFSKADIIIEDSRGLYESSSSTIYKLTNSKKIKLR